MAQILDVLNPIRNHHSAAQPRNELLDAAEAELVCDTTRVLLRYLERRLAHSGHLSPRQVDAGRIERQREPERAGQNNAAPAVDDPSRTALPRWPVAGGMWHRLPSSSGGSGEGPLRAGEVEVPVGVLDQRHADDEQHWLVVTPV